ncbi:MAG TPA: tripartite tricarboxylate transporter substrate-binding protein [Dongiaceae bacterium]|nr:tripartite tricarboxylate transporter substrate-binding protein [Dongiaceae bacterium]
MRLITSLAGAVLAGIFAASLSAAEEQDYPTNPITVIVPFAAGGPTDTVTRLVAESMSKTLGQQVIVEKVGGAGGTLGAARAAKAEPDGYTLLLHHIGMATSATLYRKLPYDPKTAFAPIGLVTEVPMVLIARKDFPPNTLQELIAYVKEHKDEVTYANAGVGAASHLCGMLFMQAIETPLTTVPYKGTGPAMTDLLGGQVDFLCDQTTNTTGQIKAGEVKAYGVFADQRLGNLPDLPTVKEGGLDGLDFAIWHGLYAPAGTPEPIIDKLSEALKAALADPKVVQRFAELGTAPVPADKATPAALQAKLLAEIDRWKPVIEKAGEYAD